jgi:hypothetical protein
MHETKSSYIDLESRFDAFRGGGGGGGICEMHLQMGHRSYLRTCMP